MLYPDFNELVQLKSKVSNLKLLSNRLVKSSINGGYFSPFRGHGLEFSEVRKYVNGDDIRKIDWQVTARTNVPYIKLFTEERERTVLIMVDTNSTMSFGTKCTFKSVQAARCASLIAWCANKNSNLVGSVLFGGINTQCEYFKPTRSRRSLWKMLQLLSTPFESKSQKIIKPSEAIEFAHKKVQKSSLVFIISDFIDIDEEFKTKLSYLSAHCQVILISVNDPFDKNIEPVGNIVFSSDKANRISIDTDNNVGRQTYKDQWDKRCSKLKDITNSLGIHNISLFTDRDVYFDLFYGLKFRASLKGK